MPSVSAATCKTVSKVAKMCSHFCKKRRDGFRLMAPLHSPFGQKCLAFSRFSGAQKEPGAGLSRSIISVLLGRTVVPAASYILICSQFLYKNDKIY